MHTLVEKPVTQTVKEADTLIAAARRAGVVLAVGHSERFNPAVAAARPHIKDPRFIEVHRLGTAPERSLDIDVVLDLMIHDLDLILSVVASEVERVEAVGVPVLTPRVDIANARVRFKNGCIANLDGQPHQQGSRAEDPVLPARCVRVDRHGGARCRSVERGAAARRGAEDRRRQAVGER